MRKNVGTIDALIRIMIGLAGLSWSTAYMVRRPNRRTPVIMSLMFGMKVAEGIVRFCPMLAAMRITTMQSCDADKSGMPYRIKKYPRSER
ncbi:YgaP family membrane protein [Aneurinibacillus terranovensis]|uniref:YgaP family membrane protein n=1 Tax=Aneurinibacillus terranovensis TaxID=278991 RepID=UPI00041C26E4|nr:DUF2892 domain-containing protein [Aneurinibacillus terranovensis]